MAHKLLRLLEALPQECWGEDEKCGQPLRARALQYDVAWFKAVLAWAVGVGMLDRNPLVGYAPPAEASPRRPDCNASQYEALLAASDAIHPLFGLALIVVHETGHRIGAVRLLRWADIDLERQLVRWRAENDKIGYEHETWLTPAAVEALQTARRSQALISEWVFPAPSDPAKPISRHLLRDWWQRGQALAKLPPEPGRGWHSLRRQFATEMKSRPAQGSLRAGRLEEPADGLDLLPTGRLGVHAAGSGGPAPTRSLSTNGQHNGQHGGARITKMTTPRSRK